MFAMSSYSVFTCILPYTLYAIEDILIEFIKIIYTNYLFFILFVGFNLDCVMQHVTFSPHKIENGQL